MSVCAGACLATYTTKTEGICYEEESDRACFYSRPQRLFFVQELFCREKAWYTELDESEFAEEHLTNMNIYDFWKAVLDQNENEIRKYFQNDAYINWHCTNERFNVDEFIIANCEYPGDWEGSVERVEMLNDLIVTVVNVYPKGRNASFHVTSFIKTKEDKIVSMDEYWADDGNAPQWRLDKHIGKAIR